MKCTLRQKGRNSQNHGCNRRGRTSPTKRLHAPPALGCTAPGAARGPALGPKPQPCTINSSISAPNERNTNKQYCSLEATRVSLNCCSPAQLPHHRQHHQPFSYHGFTSAALAPPTSSPSESKHHTKHTQTKAVSARDLCSTAILTQNILYLLLPYLQNTHFWNALEALQMWSH